MAAKKIILTEEAKLSIIEILEFYILQNGNSNYTLLFEMFRRASRSIDK